MGSKTDIRGDILYGWSLIHKYVPRHICLLICVWNWCRNDEPITKQLQRLWYRQQALLSMHGLCSVKLWYFLSTALITDFIIFVHQVITFVKFYNIFHNAEPCQHISRDFYSSIASIACYLKSYEQNLFFFGLYFILICFLGRCVLRMN